MLLFVFSESALLEYGGEAGQRKGEDKHEYPSQGDVKTATLGGHRRKGYPYDDSSDAAQLGSSEPANGRDRGR